MRLLLVEDEPQLRQQVCEFLQQQGWAVDEAADGEEGLVRTLELLREEIHIALALCGATSFADLSPDYVTHAPVVSDPAALSEFPLLD